jgi:membrane fusion protein (multidrug efflux system)
MEFPPENAAFGLVPRRGPGPLRNLLRAGLVMLLAVAPGCDDGDAEPRWDPVTVEVMRVEPELLVDVATFSGQLDAEHSVMVKSEVEGVIESIEFEQGQSVAEGDVLFRLRSREQAARLREAHANRDLAGERWKRVHQLLTRDASSKDQADVANAEFEIAKARVELAQVEFDRTQVRAPFDGVVGLRLADPGARVDEDSELVRVDSVDRLQVSFAITDIGLPFARTGMIVSVWVRPYPGERFSGEVFFVSPSLDPRSRRITVKAWIDNSDRRLAPGLFANVDLELRRVEQALVVPESAVAIDQQGSYVWVVDDTHTASRRPIEIGLRERGIVEITQGLSAGVEIVTAGTHKVSEGEEVQIAESPLIGRARGTPPEGSIIGEGT